MIINYRLKQYYTTGEGDDWKNVEDRMEK